MGDMGDMFSAYRQMKKEKREGNRQRAPQMLTEAGVHFETYNEGTHIVVPDGPSGAIDFWPGTGLWIVRSNKRRARGIFKLISFVKDGK